MDGLLSENLDEAHYQLSWRERPKALRLLVWLLLLPVKLALYAVALLTGLTALSAFVPFIVFIWYMFDEFGIGLGFLALFGIPELTWLLLMALENIGESEVWEFPWG